MNLNFIVGQEVTYYGEKFMIDKISGVRSEVFLVGYGWVDIKNIKPINKGEQMTNKQEAKQQLEKLEAEVQKLKEIINKPEKAGSLLEDGDYRLAGSNGNGLIAHNHGCHGVNSFETMSIAQAYAEAFNTMLELRKCEGSCIPTKDIFQYLIMPDHFTSGIVITGWNGADVKMCNISPSFSSKEYAKAVIDKVGKENIIKMFKTLHGIYN